MTEWSERAGWRLIWNSNRNYTLTAGAMFRGRFADVSSALINSTQITVTGGILAAFQFTYHIIQTRLISLFPVAAYI